MLSAAIHLHMCANIQLRLVETVVKDTTSKAQHRHALHVLLERMLILTVWLRALIVPLDTFKHPLPCQLVISVHQDILQTPQELNLAQLVVLDCSREATLNQLVVTVPWVT
jgi:hypothetical protein